MVALFLVAMTQLSTPRSADSIYSTPSVRRLVERASIANRRVPDSLRAYRANVESEMAFIARETDGTEETFTVEQTASRVQWDRTGRYEQRVVGYRSQSVGFTVSALGFFRQAWTVPILYGNRLTLLFGQQDTTARERRRRPRRSNVDVAVHPFAEDREQMYRFSGGDTVVTIRPDRREIPIVRVHVEPSGDHLTRRVIAFRGDVELDERRAQIVRMRGYFVTVGPKPRVRSRLVASQVEAIAYVELENGEFEQQYWLPTYQRIEAQAAIALFGDRRAVFRVVSRFRAMSVNPQGTLGAQLDSSMRAETTRTTAVAGDSLRLVPYRLTFAPTDSLNRFAGWSRDIGELTGGVRADDFQDVAPDTWRPTGAPMVRLRFEEPSDLLHYNRVEGAFTGAAVEVKLRDAAPGLVARGSIGWAWAEQTVRGRLSVERQSGRWWPSVRAGRSLEITNDFRQPFDSGSTIGALFSVDDYDYVDRRSALAGLTWNANRRRDIRFRIEAGFGSDEYAMARRERGPLARGDSGFRFNRGVDEGRYGIVSLKLEFHPGVNAALVRPGLGALVQAQTAAGDLQWHRVEIRLVARRMAGPMIYAVRADAGVVTGASIPPQQLFELGASQNLPGFGYKEFAGNQAAVLSGLAMYPVPIWRAPLRVRRMVFPSVAPSISFGAQTGWAAATNAAGRASMFRLGLAGDSLLRPGTDTMAAVPISRPTDGLKSSIDFRLRFFGGAVSLGVARATDHHDRWRFVLGLAQVL
jgi:hypothetical protein